MTPEPALLTSLSEKKLIDKGIVSFDGLEGLSYEDAVSISDRAVKLGEQQFRASVELKLVKLRQG